jgi:hypothetical protein
MRLLAEIGLVLVAAVGVAVCLGVLPPGAGPRWRPARAPDLERPGQLVTLERLVSMAGTSALQVHAYLRPVLVEIASYRLAGHGLALERMPDETGRELLGNSLWEIIRPDRPFPEDRHGAGVSAEQLRTMLDQLERL